MISRVSWLNFSSVNISSVNKLLPPIASLLLVVIITWQLTKVIWLLVPGTIIGVDVPMPDSIPQSTDALLTPININEIADSHIFGIASIDQDNLLSFNAPDDDLDDTRLINLVLNGTVASEIPNYSVAIISDGGKNQKAYIIVEPISNNATLHAIYPDRVVLNESGFLTNLKLPRELNNTSVITNRQSLKISRQSIDNTKGIQSVVAQNLTKLTDIIRPTPYRVEGEQIGFRVYPGRDREQFTKLGLQPGDIIKGIDGEVLSDSIQAMQILQTLDSTKLIKVTIERNGKTEALTLKTDQLDLNGK